MAPLTLPPAFAQIPRHSLLYPHPSPIHPLPALTKHLLPNPRPQTQITLHAKREDQASPLACSGNKYRKLEYLIPDILSPTPQYGGLGPSPERGSACAPAPPPSSSPTTTTTTPQKPTLITEGALQSNHTVQVAALATHLNLSAVLCLHKTTGGGWRTAPDPRAFARTGNVQLAKLLGADVRLLDSANVAALPNPQAKKEDSNADDNDPIASIIHTLRTREGKIPYWIPSGASLHPLGGLGYARCAFEIAAQEGDAPQHAQSWPKSRYDYIFVACGSGSTLGGLIAGFKLLEKVEGQQSQTTAAAAAARQQQQHRPPRKIIGVLTSPTSPKAYHEERVLRFARQAAGLIGLDDPQREITAADVTLEERFVGAGYGVLDAETKQAMDVVARTEAVVLDPVYTAKVARAMMHWVGSGELEEDWRRRRGRGKSETGPGKLAEEPGDAVNVLFIHTGGQSALSAYADAE
ncbi:1-aminocyclopropane-1-carboxylate deaminase/D-cysteine desulfhydrase [Aspergillus fijiensis CBS 313.89]|uniref:Tryptophan synthase beta subunit-like PLP-dependent enzyme n=1 Tax=Aspergillus fijiensis CBS 313.89 TaxID=1448319 RepID=A0A8G1RUJ0_9EURO|nr:tryptophan synthase beta subunit-like PLP-dependent enzyme [Aspergillus fijiensis CBS 313.89]RAK80377.1 tryptophan synthase beta subunit-like PLP-dependent enzyme [Aspergillus fijiensis CBS 313.89]